MSATIASTLPIFLLILVGLGLKLAGLLDQEGWRALDRLSFYLLYPVLLFVTIVKADFSGLAIPDVMLALGVPWSAIAIALLAAAPLLSRAGMVAASEFSSVFQSTVRWNGFVALAVAERLFDADAAAVVALVMAALVVPINLVSIYVVTRHAPGRARPGLAATLRTMAANPIVLACLAALALRSGGVGLPEPVMTTLDLIGRGALAMGLVGIGAGLQLAALLRPRFATWIPLALKLFALPAGALAMLHLFGADPAMAGVIVLCAAVPTAMNGYVVARQLGGDAPLYAAVVTLQTLASFLTLPFWMWIVQATP